MKKLIFFLFLVTTQVAFAQDYGIRGRVTEEENRVLPSASVFLLQTPDSAVVASTTTNTRGKFVLNDIEKGEYIFKVSFLGFAPYVKNLVIPSAAGSDTLDLGTIELQPKSIELEEVTVTEAKDAVIVKKDTVEYDAGSFSTRLNANVEQLLKKLPGLYVESDGSVSVQGENVTRIYVDGKEFFGGNLQMATKNLPADAIAKIQVIDEKSEQARFSGVDDGRRKKVINLTLKEDRRNMAFGKAMAGGGTANRYVAEGNYNRFNENKGNQVSVMGMSNNVNNQYLSSGRSSAGTGGGSSRRGFGQNGLVNTHMGGVNVFKQLAEKTSVHGNYLVNYTDAYTETNLTRQNFLPEGTAMYYESSRQENTNSMHNATAGLEHKDSLNTIRLNTDFNYSGVHAAVSSSRRSFSAADTLVNEGERNSVTRNKNFNLNTDLFYGHRFSKSGRLFTVAGQFSASRDDMEGQSASFTSFAEGTEEDVRQRNEQENNSLRFNMRFTYTEPLGKKQYLQANYSVSNQASKSDLEVFDIINETTQLNAEQSRRFRSGYLYQQAGLTYRLNRDQYNLAVGSNVQQAELSRRLHSSGDQAKQSFQNILPSLNLNVRINNATRLDFDYTTSVREPTINQLQPVVSRYDPLHLFVGNPDLRPEYTHQGRLKMNASAISSGIFLSGSMNFNYTTNPITAAVTINERQVRTTQYVNVKEEMSFMASLSAGIPVKKFNSRFNLSSYLRQGQSINLSNGVAGTINQQSVGGNFAYTYSYKEYIDVNLRTDITVTNSDYELNKNQNQTFVTSVYMADAAVHFLKNFNFTAAFNYNRFRNARTNFDQAIPVLNFSLSKFLLKDSRGELKLSAFNVLNRNVGATQFATQNYIEQSTQNALGSYYMLSFTYNLNAY